MGQPWSTKDNDERRTSRDSLTTLGIHTNPEGSNQAQLQFTTTQLKTIVADIRATPTFIEEARLIIPVYLHAKF